MSRFDYVKYDDDACNAQADLKSGFQVLEATVERLFPVGSRSKALVLTKLEEAYMWCSKQIRDDLIARNGSAPLMGERAAA
jgi:hypothetical protein